MLINFRNYKCYRSISVLFGPQYRQQRSMAVLTNIFLDCSVTLSFILRQKTGNLYDFCLPNFLQFIELKTKIYI